MQRDVTVEAHASKLLSGMGVLEVLGAGVVDGSGFLGAEGPQLQRQFHLALRGGEPGDDSRVSACGSNL